MEANCLPEGALERCFHSLPEAAQGCLVANSWKEWPRVAELAWEHRGTCNGTMNGQKWHMDTGNKVPRTLARHYLDKILDLLTWLFLQWHQYSFTYDTGVTSKFTLFQVSFLWHTLNIQKIKSYWSRFSVFTKSRSLVGDCYPQNLEPHTVFHTSSMMYWVLLHSLPRCPYMTEERNNKGSSLVKLWEKSRYLLVTFCPWHK